MSVAITGLARVTVGSDISDYTGLFAPPCSKVSPVLSKTPDPTVTPSSPITVTARPVQIGAHHHIDVYTGINEKWP